MKKPERRKGTRRRTVERRPANPGSTKTGYAPKRIRQRELRAKEKEARIVAACRILRDAVAARLDELRIAYEAE